MTDQEIFNQHYRCHVEKTDRVAYYQTYSAIQVGTLSPNTIIPSETKVLAIYIPEDMAEELIKDVADRVKEAELRRKDPRLLKLYSEYKTLLTLLK